MSDIKPRPATHEFMSLYLLNQRQGLTKQQKSQFQNLLNGYFGECLFDSFVREFGNSNWHYLQDVMVKVNGKISQIDGIIITANNIYIIEVKYFNNNHTVKDHCWTSTKFSFPDEIFIQLTRGVNKIKHILRENQINYSVKGILVFTCPHSEQTILDNVDFLVLQCNQIRNKLIELAVQEFNPVSGLEKILNAIQTFTIEETDDRADIDHRTFQQMLKGPICHKCRSFQLAISKQFFLCHHCGAKELKSNATDRLIKEYAILNRNKCLKANPIHKFIDGKIDIRTIQRVLNSRYKKVDSTQTSAFLNPHPIIQFSLVEKKPVKHSDIQALFSINWKMP